MTNTLVNKLRAGSAAFILAATGSLTTMPAAIASADPYLGELMLFGGGYCPRGWSQAAGQLLPISQNTALFSILGTIYGGDGRTTYGLPDLRGRAPIGIGAGPGLSNHNLGQKSGQEMQVLSTLELPSHNHNLETVETTVAEGTKKIRTVKPDLFTAGSPAGFTSNTGASLAFSVADPKLAMQWCIATTGLFPSRN